MRIPQADMGHCLAVAHLGARASDSGGGALPAFGVPRPIVAATIGKKAAGKVMGGEHWVGKPMAPESGLKYICR